METEKKIAEAINKTTDALKDIEGIEIELCGTWLWIDGNTYENREALKNAGCRFSRTKKKWYWRPEEKSAGWSRGKSTMADIRQKYGSAWMRKEETAA